MKKKSDSSKLTIPNDLSYGMVVGAYVDAVAEKMGFDEEDRQMIQLGVDETFSNVITHAFDPEEEATCDIITERIPLGLRITFKEKGLPFDPSQLPRYDPTADLASQSGKGLGTFLIKQSMDEVHYNNLGKEGKETQLIRYLKRKNIEDYFNESELVPYDESAEVVQKPKEPIEFTIQRLKPSQAIEVSKCIYKTYGYTYDNEKAYFPERIIELNENGLISSIVALAPEGEVAGHCALLKENPDDTIAEVGMAVVKPEFRGQGCLNRLSELRLEIATSQGLIGLFGRGVTTHPYSQRAMHKYGFRVCAILLATIPTTRSYKKITEHISQRDSHVVLFMYLNKPESLTIYPPLEHGEMIQKIYKNIGYIPQIEKPTIPQKEGTPMIKSIQGQSQVNTKVLSSKSCAYIEVNKYGSDILHIVHAQLRELCLKRIEGIYLYLNLMDPLTSLITPEFEQLGFFFSGVLPGRALGDTLILQYLNNVPLDYEKIAIDSTLAKELLDYIQNRDPNIKDL